MLQVPFWEVYSYSVGQELEDSVPHSHQPNLGSCNDPVEYSPHFHILCHEDSL